MIFSLYLFIWDLGLRKNETNMPTPVTQAK